MENTIASLIKILDLIEKDPKCLKPEKTARKNAIKKAIEIIELYKNN